MINLHNGIREVDLALIFLELILPQDFDSEKYHKIIDDLISSGKIRRLVYIERGKLGEKSAGIKSIFFTEDTEILVDATGAFSDKMVRESKGDT